MRGILPIGCALALLGCGKAGGQSFHDGVDLICRADVESSASSPQITPSVSAASSTVRVIGPI